MQSGDITFELFMHDCTSFSLWLLTGRLIMSLFGAL
jgi:uncharacterized protein with PQ loop repeat